MINTLDNEVKAVRGVDTVSLLPKGKYTITLTVVGDWEKKTLKAVKEIKFDDKFRKEKDANGNDITVMHDTYDMWISKCRFEVADGPHKGRLLFHDVTTHPNIPWAIPQLLGALGVESLALSKLNTLVGHSCTAFIGTKSYPKDETDEDGFTTTVMNEKNIITKFLDPVEESY